MALLWLILFPIPTLASEIGRVVEVVDGDTVRVRTADGMTRAVRLIGIDAPEKGHPAKGREFHSEESSRHLLSLCEGRDVRLESGAEDADKYGRLLRYVYVPSPGGRGAESLVNLEMVRGGHARVMRRFPFSRQADFLDAEMQARREGRGIWAKQGMEELRWLRVSGARPIEVWPAGGDRFIVAYRGAARPDVDGREIPKAVAEILRLNAELAGQEFDRAARAAGYFPVDPADAGPAEASGGFSSAGGGNRALPAAGAAADAAVTRWEDAAKHVGKTITVEGKIVRTRKGKKVLFLNFHPNWKKYLTIVVLGADLRRFPADAEQRYRDRVVRVTGDVAIYKGRPEIVVRSPDEIVVVR